MARGRDVRYGVRTSSAPAAQPSPLLPRLIIAAAAANSAQQHRMVSSLRELEAAAGLLAATAEVCCVRCSAPEGLAAAPRAPSCMGCSAGAACRNSGAGARRFMRGGAPRAREERPAPPARRDRLERARARGACASLSPLRATLSTATATPQPPVLFLRCACLHPGRPKRSHTPCCAITHKARSPPSLSGLCLSAACAPASDSTRTRRLSTSPLLALRPALRPPCCSSLSL